MPTSKMNPTISKSTKYAKNRSEITRTTTTSKPTTMIQYTDTEFVMQPALSKYDESAVDPMAAYLDFSSYATPLSTTTTTTHSSSSSTFEHAFGIGPLRPVDDALLDSPLDLELSPALSTYDSMSSSSGASSCFSSPFLVDFDGPVPGTGSGGSISPALVDDLHHATSSSSSSSYPSLFAPVPAATTTDIDMVALATSLGVTLPPLMAPTTAPAPAPAPVPTLSFIREEDEEEEEDVKPDVGDLLVSPGTGTVVAGGPTTVSSAERADTEDVAVAPAATALAPESTSRPAAAPSSSSSSSSSGSGSGAEAATATTAKRDKFTGIRNTKKPPVAYDAPTLPKNYYTESATSKKRRASPSSSSSSGSSNKRVRSEVSVTPEEQPVPVAVARLPSAQPEPMPEDEFDESQLSAIELKRRQNTLAARRSRARKSAYIQELKDEIDQLKQVNEQLLAQLAGGATCASCGGGGGP